ncbi:hypothetical protein [Streptacidiphilus jiangxiensis]|uniref:hypothetical protein n=1 Tax=Streptacidiphilus jiangxiensis TaxID=235985 RepID=UPI0013767056|nr:hypothetical protein [Streptacidiphilus jiangxiensis]
MSETPADIKPIQPLRLLDLPGLGAADGDVPVCGPDGCAVPTAPAASEQAQE